MNDASLYARFNTMPKRDATKILRQYASKMIWSDEDIILDAGCGNGDTTRNILLPYCHSEAKIVGVDKLAEMIMFAWKNFPHENISYVIMDLEDEVEQLKILFPQTFTKIFSFYCLHWIQKQSQVINMFYHLLKPGGYCLLVFLAMHPMFDVYKIQANKTRWAPYLMDYEKFVPVQHKFAEPEKEFRQTLEECGFNVIDCVAPELTFAFETPDTFKKTLRAVNPFVSRMPTDIQEEFLTDCLNELTLIPKQINTEIISPRYKLMVAFAKKKL